MRVVTAAFDPVADARDNAQARAAGAEMLQVKTKKAVAIAAPSAFVGAFVPPLLVLHMMAENNNNGELFDTVTGQWDVGYAFEVAAVLYVPAFLVIFALAFGVARLWSVRADAS